MGIAVEGRGPVHYKLNTCHAGDTFTVEVHGEFDLAAVPAFHDAMSEMLPAESQLVADLRGLTFMDGSALNELVSVHEWSCREGFGLTILAPPHPAYRVIELTEMDGHLPIVPQGLGR